MNYIDWHQSKDERPSASDGSRAWLAALEALPRDELTRMANAIEAELEHQRSGTSPSRFVIEDSGNAGNQFSSRGQLSSSNEFSSDSQFSSSNSQFSEPRAPAWLLRARDRKPTHSSEILNDTGYLTDDVPSPPPRFLPPALTRRPTPIPRTSIRTEAG